MNITDIMNISHNLSAEDCKMLYQEDLNEKYEFYASLIVNFLLLLTTLGSEMTGVSKCKANSLMELFCGKCKKEAENMDSEEEDVV